MIFYGPFRHRKDHSGIHYRGNQTEPTSCISSTRRPPPSADIRQIFDELGTLIAPNGALVYLDEIQYFNKKQQQSLLEFIEDGRITLIASTTENPYFYVLQRDLKPQYGV